MKEISFYNFTNTDLHFYTEISKYFSKFLIKNCLPTSEKRLCKARIWLWRSTAHQAECGVQSLKSICLMRACDCFEGTLPQMGARELEKIVRHGTQRIKRLESMKLHCEKVFRDGINAIITQQVDFGDSEFLL